jgi:hypothetical protein
MDMVSMQVLALLYEEIQSLAQETHFEPIEMLGRSEDGRKWGEIIGPSPARQLSELRVRGKVCGRAQITLQLLGYRHEEMPPSSQWIEHSFTSCCVIVITSRPRACSFFSPWNFIAKGGAVQLLLEIHSVTSNFLRPRAP